MAGDDLVPFVDPACEVGDGSGVVMVQADADESGQAQTEAFTIEFGAVAGDHPAALESLHAAQAGRGREVHALGQFGVAQPAFALQLGEQLDVDAIKGVGRRHGPLPVSGRNDIAPDAADWARIATILRA